MTERTRFKEGDKVRDRAQLGGTVIETWGNGVKVSWNNMTTDWIDERFLHRDGEGESNVIELPRVIEDLY